MSHIQRPVESMQIYTFRIKTEEKNETWTKNDLFDNIILAFLSLSLEFSLCQ